MVFKTNTQPLSDALALGVVNSNVSKFYLPSCVALVSANKTELRVNLEAQNLTSEIKLNGMGSDEAEVSIFVDCLLFKQIVSTFDTSTIDLEFQEDGLTLYSGKSKFTLPKMIDEEINMKKPSVFDPNLDTIDIMKENWKFVKDHQMYAIAMNFIYPVYTRVYVGQNGDVIVGDFDNSLFTHSMMSNLGETCLLSNTIINLLNSIPEGAKLVKENRKYLIYVKTDGYEFTSEFTPEYEDDPDVGTYNADMILGIMRCNEDDCIKINPSSLNKFLSQADLFLTSNDDTITMSYADGEFSLVGSNVDCKVDVESTCTSPWSVDFKSNAVKSVINTYDCDEIKICPLVDEESEEMQGITVWSTELITVLSGVE